MTIPRHYAPHQMLPGTPYLIVRFLGEGGMGAVYEVIDTSVDLPYVVKTLHGGEGSGKFAAIIKKEAKILGKLQHPNIVRVFTGGTTADGLAYLVMERLEGCTLAALLNGTRLNGGLPAAYVAQISAELCSVFAYVHEGDPTTGRPPIIHRDVKPENIFLAKRPALDEDGKTDIYRSKMLDFGIADVLSGVNVKSKGFTGSPPYASPEQVQGQPLTHRTDLYSFGIVLFQMLTGRHPFENLPTIEAMLMAHVMEKPPRVSDLVRGIPDEVDACVAAALAKNPADRPRDAYAMSIALRALRATNGRTVVFLSSTTVEDLHTVVERNTQAGYELYASQVSLNVEEKDAPGGASGTIEDPQSPFGPTAPPRKVPGEATDLLRGLERNQPRLPPLSGLAGALRASTTPRGAQDFRDTRTRVEGRRAAPARQRTDTAEVDLDGDRWPIPPAPSWRAGQDAAPAASITPPSVAAPTTAGPIVNETEPYPKPPAKSLSATAAAQEDWRRWLLPLNVAIGLVVVATFVVIVLPRTRKTEGDTQPSGVVAEPTKGANEQPASAASGSPLATSALPAPVEPSAVPSAIATERRVDARPKPRAVTSTVPATRPARSAEPQPPASAAPAVPTPTPTSTPRTDISREI